MSLLRTRDFYLLGLAGLAQTANAFKFRRVKAPKQIVTSFRCNSSTEILKAIQKVLGIFDGNHLDLEGFLSSERKVSDCLKIVALPGWLTDSLSSMDTEGLFPYLKEVAAAIPLGTGDCLIKNLNLLGGVEVHEPGKETDEEYFLIMNMENRQQYTEKYQSPGAFDNIVSLSDPSFLLDGKRDTCSHICLSNNTIAANFFLAGEHHSKDVLHLPQRAAQAAAGDARQVQQQSFMETQGGDEIRRDSELGEVTFEQLRHGCAQVRRETQATDLTIDELREHWSKLPVVEREGAEEGEEEREGDFDYGAMVEKLVRECESVEELVEKLKGRACLQSKATPGLTGAYVIIRSMPKMNIHDVGDGEVFKGPALSVLVTKGRIIEFDNKYVEEIRIWNDGGDKQSKVTLNDLKEKFPKKSPRDMNVLWASLAVDNRVIQKEKVKVMAATQLPCNVNPKDPHYEGIPPTIYKKESGLRITCCPPKYGGGVAGDNHFPVEYVNSKSDLGGCDMWLDTSDKVVAELLKIQEAMKREDTLEHCDAILSKTLPEIQAELLAVLKKENSCSDLALYIEKKLLDMETPRLTGGCVPEAPVFFTSIYNMTLNHLVKECKFDSERKVPLTGLTNCDIDFSKKVYGTFTQVVKIVEKEMGQRVTGDRNLTDVGRIFSDGGALGYPEIKDTFKFVPGNQAVSTKFISKVGAELRGNVMFCDDVIKEFVKKAEGEIETKHVSAVVGFFKHAAMNVILQSNINRGLLGQKPADTYRPDLNSQRYIIYFVWVGEDDKYYYAEQGQKEINVLDCDSSVNADNGIVLTSPLVQLSKLYELNASYVKPKKTKAAIEHKVFDSTQPAAPNLSGPSFYFTATGKSDSLKKFEDLMAKEKSDVSLIGDLGSQHNGEVERTWDLLDKEHSEAKGLRNPKKKVPLLNKICTGEEFEFAGVGNIAALVRDLGLEEIEGLDLGNVQGFQTLAQMEAAYDKLRKHVKRVFTERWGC